MPKATGALGLRVQKDSEAMSVTVQVFDYKAESVVDQDVFSFNDIPKALQPDVSLYGLVKLLMDRNSQVKENPKAKLAGMAVVMDRLIAGEWEAERTGGGLGIVSPEVQAVAELKGITIPEAQAALKAYDKPTREKILSSKKVIDRAAKIRENRKEGEVQKLDDLL